MKSCPICGKKCNDLLKHVSRIHKIDPETFFKTYVEPWEHVCKICGKPTEYDVRRKRFKYVCRDCSKHKKQDYYTQKLTCLICKKTFTNYANLGVHLKDHHLSMREYRAKYEPQHFECQRCHASLDHKHKLCKKCRDINYFLTLMHKYYSIYFKIYNSFQCYLRKHPTGGTRYYSVVLKHLNDVTRKLLYYKMKFKETRNKWNSILPVDSPLCRYQKMKI
jgi:hypothetical protein